MHRCEGPLQGLWASLRPQIFVVEFVYFFDESRNNCN